MDQPPISGRTGCGHAGGFDGCFCGVVIRCSAQPAVAAVESVGWALCVGVDRRDLRIDNRHPLLSAPLAVGLAIGAMHYLRCIHPPGGATALTAVAGGASVHELGYHFVLTPVLLNVSILMITAVVVNFAFPWRRYPASLMKLATELKQAQRPAPKKLHHDDFEYALREIGSFIDISEEDLTRIYELAHKHARELAMRYRKLAVGRTFSNDPHHAHWSVRQVIELPHDWHDEQAEVHFRAVAGHEQGETRTAKLVDFANWMKHEVVREQGNWVQV